MIGKLKKSKGMLLLLSILGWVLFPGMYLLIDILGKLEFPVQISFLIAASSGLIGFLLWVAAFFISIVWLVKAKNIAVSVGALVLSVVPLAFLFFAYLVALSGGV